MAAHPNDVISRTAKCGALLQKVHDNGGRPSNLSPGTLKVWEAMVFLKLVDWSLDGRAWLSEGGKELLRLANEGSY